MTERTPRRLRNRRLARWAVAVLALLVLGLGAAWYFAPVLLEYGFRRAATGFGFEEAAVAVDRAGFAVLHAKEMHLRRGGVELNLADATITYAPGGLMDGRVNRVVIDGLALTLDFTLPRRGLMPDAVAELLGEGGGGGFSWPIDDLTLRDSRVAAILPNGKQSLTMNGDVRRMPDGRVSFDLRVAHEAAGLHVTGLLQTETLDGDLALVRAALEPATLLEIAAQLGLFELPAGVAIESDVVEIAGTVMLVAGSPRAYSGGIDVPRVRVAAGDLEATITAFSATIGASADADVTGELDIAVEARSRAEAWAAGPLVVQGRLAGGVASGEVQPFDVSWGESVKARLGLRLEAGLPQFGGAPNARLTASMSGVSIGGHALKPVEVVASGWTDRVEVSLSEIREAEGGFAAIDSVAAVVTDPLGAVRAFEGSATISTLPALREFLPAKWSLVEPALPAELARIAFSGSWKDGVPSGVATVRSLPPSIRIAAGETGFAFAPDFVLRLAVDDSAVSGAFSLDASEVETRGLVSIPDMNAFSVGAEIPRVRFEALASLLDGRFPQENLAFTLQGTLANSAATGTSMLRIARDAASGEWSARAEGTLANASGTFAGWDVEQLGGTFSIDAGAWPDARVAAWLRVRNLETIAHEIIPGLALDVTLSASSVAKAEAARAEWVAASLVKTRASPGGVPVEAAFNASAGILRTGPEVLEQPAIEARLSGGFTEFDLGARVTALLEGKPLALETRQRLAVDWERPGATGAGEFTIAPLTLVSSDIAGRWAEAAKGVSLSATVSAGGAIKYSSAGTWDGSGRVSLVEGSIAVPAQELRVEGVFADIAVESLSQMRMSSGQTIGFARLTKGEISATEGRVQFHTTGLNRLFVEDAAVSLFGGRISTGAFSLFFPNPDVAVVLHMDDLDLAQLTTKLELFQGSLSGRADGQLPIGLLAGKLIFGQGYLALDPAYPARFSYDAKGIFTGGLPGGSGVAAQFTRLPYELLEEGLGVLDIESFRAELFRRDLPLTPIRLHFSGRSETPRAEVPFDITTNINGSVRDIIEFLVQAFVL